MSGFKVYSQRERVLNTQILLTFKKHGMPAVYKEYVYLIVDETVEGLANTLKVVLSKTREELHQKGQEAKCFVLDKKNNEIQAKKIFEMIKRVNQKNKGYRND